MNPYAPPEGRIVDTQSEGRTERGAALWLLLVVCVLHSVLMSALLSTMAFFVDDGTTLSHRLKVILAPTLVVQPLLTFLAAWGLFKRKRTAVLPLACLPVAIIAHSSHVHVTMPVPYFSFGVVLAVYGILLVVAKRLR